MSKSSHELRAPGSDAALATSLKKWWPHREHESSSLKAFSCFCGIHRWRELKIQEFLPPGKEVRFCHWCSKIRINGVIYEP
jgi:hypothetical protein